MLRIVDPKKARRRLQPVRGSVEQCRRMYPKKKITGGFRFRVNYVPSTLSARSIIKVEFPGHRSPRPL